MRCNHILIPFGVISLLTCPTYCSWECGVIHQTASLVLLGIYFLFEGTWAGLKSTWTSPSSTWRTELSNCWASSVVSKGKKHNWTDNTQRKKESQSQRQSYIPIRSGLTSRCWHIKKTQYIMWMPKSIKNQSIKKNSVIFLNCHWQAPKPQPSGAQWLLILCNELRAIWWFNMGVYTGEGEICNI